MDQELPLVEHLTELRRRLIYSLAAVAVGVAVGWIWIPSLYRWIMNRAPAPITQIGITQVFLVQFNLGLWVGILLASPVILYQLVAFILPALKPNERRLVWGLLPAIISLFLIGFLFSFLFVVPAATRFFISVAKDSGAAVIVSPTDWLDLIMHFSLPLGAVFELPVVVWLLAAAGLITAKRLRSWRKYAVLGALVVGALISPAPMVVDQLVMAVPLLLLYEISIGITALVERRRSAELH